MSITTKRHVHHDNENGWMPADWEKKCIGDMTDVSAGGTPSTHNDKYWNPPEVPWMSSGEVHSRRIYTTEKKISLVGLKNSSAKIFPKKSIVMALAGQGKTRGSVAVLESETTTNQSLAAIYPNQDFETDFLFHNLDWRYKELRSLSSGEGGRGGLNLAIIKSIQVALPPLTEQKKISNILNSVDDKLNIITSQIGATQTLKYGLMQTLFSKGAGIQDKHELWIPHVKFKNSTIGNIPENWNVLFLRDISSERKIRNFNRLSDELLCGVLKEQGLVPMRERVKGATTERCRIVEPNHFAYNPMRINIGSIARNLRNHSVMVSPDYVVFSVHEEVLMSRYLDYFRYSDSWRQFVERSGDGGVRIRIYYDDLAQLRIKVPPLNEQARIVEILDNITAKLTNLNNRKSELQILKRGLMQRLLTGELRVKVDDTVTT